MKTFLKTLVNIFVFSYPLIACSQLPSQLINWQNTIGADYHESVVAIHQTADGGYIVGGNTSSGASCDKAENNMGLGDIWLVRLDASGSIIWENAIGGSDVDDIGDLIITSDGGYLIAGYSMSGISGDKTEANMGTGYDYWIIKTDDLGNIQWQNTIGGASDDQLKSVCQTPDGGYILGGSSISWLSGDKTENDIGVSDYWIVKTDSLGNVQWDNTIGGNSQDDLTSIVVTSDSGFLMGGVSQSNISGDKTENIMGQQDFWVVKTDSAGAIQWQNTIGGDLYDELISIDLTNDGGFILGGNTVSGISGDKTEAGMGNVDIWVVKIDASGNIQWQNDIGGNNIDHIQKIQQSGSGEFVLFAFSNSDLSGDKTEPAIDTTNNMVFDYWIVKTDTAGVVIWDKTIGGSWFDEIRCGQCLANGEIIIAGSSLSPISADKTENNCGGNNVYDIWIVNLFTNYNTITGSLFYDLNNNLVQDATEFPIAYKTIMETNSGRMAFTDAAGFYRLTVPDTGNFEVSPVNVNFYNPAPAFHTGNFTNYYLTDNQNDFALQPAGMYNDVCVTISPVTPFRPGSNALYQLDYVNSGTTSLNATLMFYPDANVTYTGSNVIPSAITNDSIVWLLGILSPGQSGSILVYVEVDIVMIGTVINSGAFIEPILGDDNPACNQAYCQSIVTGGFDPNDIIVDADTLLSTQFPSPPYLEYIIRFQNTGTDTAFNISVINPIDVLKLQPASFEMVSSSHPVSISYHPENQNMVYSFTNIQLPDSNINEQASHGFIRYRIFPASNLVAGDQVTNFASIYFDFNAPVLTNTAITQIVLPTSLNEISTESDNLVLYPNPASSTLTIETGNLPAAHYRLIISDVAGRILFSNPISGNSTKQEIDISVLLHGIYFVQIEGGERIKRCRFVKE